MIKISRFEGNPILKPNLENNWEKEAVFNGCPIEDDGKIHLLYRAMSSSQNIAGVNLELSTIGCATSFDKVHFENRRQLIVPEYDWEKFGCEDPRVTKMDGKYYIFYTALSDFPPSPSGIKLGVAITKDFQKIEEKHQVTYFNSKAMALFPERVNGKMVAILTVHTDMPPSSIAIALFDNQSQMWDKNFWDEWYASLEDQSIHLLRSLNDHIEIGAPPVKTEEGWLLIYCYIRNYRSHNRTFGIEAALLDLNNPYRVLSTTDEPLFVPERDYELYGKVPNVIFPSGVLVSNEEVGIYYGASDTSCCLATCSLKDLVGELRIRERHQTEFGDYKNITAIFEENPIISPIPEHHWEAKYTFNPAAIYLKGRVHILYRAMGKDDTSVLGYASTMDGFHIDERLEDPVYVPRESFEKKLVPGFSGCEDPRLTRIGNRIYMCYTAYDGKNPTRVAFTSISVKDFVNKVWSWKKPVLISPPGVDDKNCCVLPEKINGKYVFLHRIAPSIWIDFVDNLEFGKDKYLGGKVLFRPRAGRWDSEKIGIGPPPIKTEDGWLLIYHSLCWEDRKYRLGAALLALDDPSKLISRLDYPILEPIEESTNKGYRYGTVFACGAVVFQDQIFVYYGGADQYVCVATVDLPNLLNLLKKNKQ